MENICLWKRTLEDTKRLQEILRIDCISVLPETNLNKCKSSYVYLTMKAIHYNAGIRRQSIQLADVTGCHHMRANEKLDLKGYFRVYSYRLCKKNGRRERESVTFVFDKGDSEENWKTGQLWHKAVNLLLRGITHLSRDVIHNKKWPEKKVLVIINPVSGRKKGMQTYWNIVAPMLVEASYKFRSIVTTGQGHASQVIMSENLSRWTAILLIGGDGILYEVVNALMHRNDWRRAIQTPLGLIPAGSGNGLVATVLHEKHEMNVSNQQVNSMFTFLKGVPRPIDISYVKIGSLEFYSFLSVSWGALADVDINSEKLRFIGESRFPLWCLGKIMLNDNYQARLRYVEHKCREPFNAIEIVREDSSLPIVKEVYSETLRPSDSVLLQLPSDEDQVNGDAGGTTNYEDEDESELELNGWDNNTGGEASQRATTHRTGATSVTSEGIELLSRANTPNNLSNVWVEQQQRNIHGSPLKPKLSTQNENSSAYGSPSGTLNTNNSQMSLPGKYADKFRDDFDSETGDENAETNNEAANGATNYKDSDDPAQQNGEASHVHNGSSQIESPATTNREPEKAGPSSTSNKAKNGQTTPLFGKRSIKRTESDSSIEDGQKFKTPQQLRPRSELQQNSQMDSSIYPTVSISEIVPKYSEDEWQAEDCSNFFFVLASNVTHLASDMYFAPQAKLNDGRLQLGYCAQPVSRTKLLRIITKVSEGEHLNFPEMVFKSVKAFEIEFNEVTEDMNLVIDGEKVPNALKISCTVLPGLARFVY